MACCGSNKVTKTSSDVEAPVLDLRDVVRDGYTKVAEQGALSPAAKSSCCGSGWKADDLAAKLGYSTAELKALPEGTNMGLSCGNPTAIANLKPGQVVLDLGSGGGFDVFLAGPKVGATGRVIGVDMTPAMLSKARKNLEHYRRTTKLDNVEFRMGEIEHLPVADNSVDVVISNCVINLSPDKPQVWREIARVLKPGGTVAVSDIALLRPLPDALREKAESLVGCVAGAVPVDEYRAMIEQAGLQNVQLRSKPEYVAAMVDSQDSLQQEIARLLPAGTTAADFITSLDVTAVKAELSSRTQAEGVAMRKVQVFDPPMCCSTGVCGPNVDPELPRFAADLEWLQHQGVSVERFNLAQQPGAFVANELVKKTLAEKGNACLPLILSDGQIASTGKHPARDELARIAGLAVPQSTSTWSPAIEELVAIGASIGCNCMPCLKYHTDKARALGVSDEDMAKAVSMAQKVKDTPARLIMELANRYLHGKLEDTVAETPEAQACCTGSAEGSPAAKGRAAAQCCG